MRRTIGRLALALGVWLAGPGGAAAQSAPVALPVYGNWCGPGHPATLAQAMTLGPVDRLDAACRNHDLCAWRRGGFDCGCDLAFLDELRRLRFDTPEQAYTARAMGDAVSMMPCRDPAGMVRKQSRFWADLAADVSRGVSPWAAPERFHYLYLRMLYGRRAFDYDALGW